MTAPASIRSVDRVRDLGLDALKVKYFDRGIPVVIEGYFDAWPASGTWSPSYLAENFGDRVVPVVSIIDGDYANSPQIDMTLNDYFEVIGAIGDPASIEAAATKQQKYYLAQVGLASVLPELLDDLEIPPFFPDESYGTTTMYAGGTLFSQLHCHAGGSATLCLLHGTKHVRLFHPEQSRNLYPYPFYSNKYSVSRTTEGEPDARKYPDFATAEYLDVTLGPGDMLFIPIYWWHSIDNAGFSVSAVMFWNTTWVSRFLPPPGHRLAYLWRPFARLSEKALVRVTHRGKLSKARRNGTSAP